MTVDSLNSAVDTPQLRDARLDSGNRSVFARFSYFRQTHLRFEIVMLLFFTLMMNQVQRAGQSIAGQPMSHALHLTSSQLGWLFSAFAWSYMLFQVPGGAILDRFGAKRVLGMATVMASSFVALVSLTPLLGTWAIPTIFVLIFLFGMASAPTYPSCSKIVAAWFPENERATAVATYNSSQFIAAGVFSPFNAWLATHYGWRSVWVFIGMLGLTVGTIFLMRFNFPLKDHRLTKQEYDVLLEGDAQVRQATRGTSAARKDGESSPLKKVGRLLTNRQMLGLYLGQYCEGALLYFFLTWFPIYLVRARHVPLLHAGMMVTVPALFGFVGALLGGVLSDVILRRTGNLTIARKAPIYIGSGLGLTMIACNYVNSLALVVFFMALANFGRALAALGWAVVADMSPRNALGLNGSIFNSFGNAAGIVMPVVVGYLVQELHSFNAALIFVALHGALAIISYAVIVGPVKRLDPI